MLLTFIPVIACVVVIVWLVSTETSHKTLQVRRIPTHTEMSFVLNMLSWQISDPRKSMEGGGGLITGDNRQRQHLRETNDALRIIRVRRCRP